MFSSPNRRPIRIYRYDDRRTRPARAASARTYCACAADWQDARQTRPVSAMGMESMNLRIALLVGLSIAGAFSAGTVHAQEAAPAAPHDASVEPKPFIYWSDNSLTPLVYGSGFVVDPDEQSTITFEHAHGSKIGDLFVFVDAIKFHGAPRGADDSTWYGEISPRLSLGKTLDKDLSFTLVDDVLVAATYERGEDADTAEAALVGVGFDLDVAKSGFKYLQLNVYGRSELTEGARNGFHDVQVTLVAARPFTVGKARILADGYFDWVLGLGSQDWNYHLNPQVSVDVGNLWGAPDRFFAGVEVDLWWNKYQIPNSPGFDTNQSAISLLFKYHL
jgi:nucleoside-specific outer membrane channel protein Tsx